MAYDLHNFEGNTPLYAYELNEMDEAIYDLINGEIGVVAEKLETARSIQVDLSSTDAADFDGSADIEPGITGTLAVSHGGTGQTTAAKALYTLISGANSLDDSSVAEGDYLGVYDVSAQTGKKITFSNIASWVQSTIDETTANQLETLLISESLQISDAAVVLDLSSEDDCTATVTVTWMDTDTDVSISAVSSNEAVCTVTEGDSGSSVLLRIAAVGAGIATVAVSLSCNGYSGLGNKNIVVLVGSIW